MSGSMRWIALILLLSSPGVLAAPTGSTSRKKRKASPPVVRPEPQPAPAPESPAAAPPRASTRRAPAAAPEQEPTRYALALAGGGFYGGGFNRGPLASAQLTITPPGWGPFSLDVELGWRQARFRRTVPGSGDVVSALHTIPLYALARFSAVKQRHFGLDLRAGLGPQLAVHQLASNFAAPTFRSALGWELLAGAQLLFPLGAFEPFLDARVGLGEAYIPFVTGRATGFQALLGVRYHLP